MKKGLLTVLLASLVLVGCQNYDDQFDDLNAQISALKSQVDGLASLSGQVSSLSGTISGLQAGVSAAQAAATAAGASADAATAAGNAATAAVDGIAATDLSGLEASLASLATDVAAVQASLATAATAAAVTALQAEIDAIESDLDELLTSSNIYATDVSVTSAATLDSALALGNKLNVLNASLTITGYAGMDYTKVQTLADRVNTTTGNIVYSAYSATGTEIKFNNLTSAGNITMTQPNGYSFPKLTNAGTIDLKDDYETTVTNISFPLLTTATAISTDATGDFTVEFLYATNVDFGSMVTAPSNTISITTKKGSTLDLSKWVAKTATGTYQTAAVTLNGPASWTNGTAAGTFASTGLPGNTVGAHDGSYSLTNVATVAIHNFRGTITLNTGVTSFTGNNIVSATISGATDLETVNITQIRDNDASLSSGAVADLGESAMNTAQDLLFTSSHAKLTSVTVTGKTGDVKFTSVPVLATVDLTGADAFDVMASGNASMSSWTDASKAEDRTFINNDLMTSVNLSATTKLSNTTDKSQTVEVSGNAELASLTLGMSNISTLNITDNAKLATISAASLTARGTASQTSVDVDIHQNALIATSIQDTKEAPTATVVAGATSDLGSITTDSGIKTLDTYLTSAMGATTGLVSVWFDTVSKLETQATYGGAFTDVTTSLTAPTAWDDTTAASNAASFGSPYTGYYAYAFDRPVVTAVTATSGARLSQNVTYAFDVNRSPSTYTELALGTNEGLIVAYDGGSTTFKQGDTYNGSTVTTVQQLVDYINADTTLDALGINLIADRQAFEKTLATITYTTSSLNGIQNTAASLSTVGNIWYTVDTTESGTASYFSTTPAATAMSDIREALRTELNNHNFNATAGDQGGQLVVSRMISGGTTTDRSGLSYRVNVTPYIDAAGTSSTAKFLTGNVSNTAARTSGNFAFTVTEADLSGIRVTLRNTGSVAFATAVSLYGAPVSNTAIVTTLHGDGDGGADGANGAEDLLVAGTNIATYNATTNAGVAGYVTGYTDITAGTTSTTTAGVTNVLTNRTGW